jgi:transmembrane sensor
MKSPQRLELGDLELGWDDGRTERLLARVKTRLDRRARVRRAVLASAVLTSAVCGVLVSLRAPPPAGGLVSVAPRASAQHPAPAPLVLQLIRLDEGSEIRVDPGTSEVRVLEEQPSRVRIEAVRGSARYSVVPRAGRTFEVVAGAVTVGVVGTEFVVERRGEQTWVEVSRGRVRVSWGEGDEHAFVAAGASGLFPRAAPTTPAESPGVTPGGAGASATRPAPPSRAYRSRIGRHDYRAAYTMLARHPGLAGDTVEELLLAADVARLSEHPAEAVPYLRRILRDHSRDERAHQAAFTLGRTLTRLGRTQEALEMFARVRRDWPGNPLVEDALVRQAQAATKLGDEATARRLAEEYERDYPRGRRGAEVRRHARPE